MEEPDVYDKYCKKGTALTVRYDLYVKGHCP